MPRAQDWECLVPPPGPPTCAIFRKNPNMQVDPQTASRTWTRLRDGDGDGTVTDYLPNAPILWCPVSRIAMQPCSEEVLQVWQSVAYSRSPRLDPDCEYQGRLRAAFVSAALGKSPSPPPFGAYVVPTGQVGIIYGRHRWLAVTTLGLSHAPIVLFSNSHDFIHAQTGTLGLLDAKPLSSLPWDKN